MNKITILDTSIATLNLGDQIIVDAVSKQLKNIFPNDIFLNVPTHEYLGNHSKKIIKQSKYSFVAGTNLLNSKYKLLRNNSWKLKLTDAKRFDEFILVGVGWGAYQKDSNILSKYMYKNVLNSNVIHSVRDNYTKKKLEDIGITNVINTSCATMWDLTPEFCKDIPEEKAENVIFTITDYNRDPAKDQELINILRKNYNTAYLWLQGSRDNEYINTLDINGVVIVPPNLAAFDEILESELSLDYVGTRLHAGIRAMQKKRRAIIIGIDNRAMEKKKDFNINVIFRDEIEKLENYISEKVETRLTIDFEGINDWKNQFMSI